MMMGLMWGPNKTHEVSRVRDEAPNREGVAPKNT